MSTWGRVLPRSPSRQIRPTDQTAVAHPALLTAFVAVVSVAAIVLVLLAVPRVEGWADVAVLASVLWLCSAPWTVRQGPVQTSLGSVVAVASFIVVGVWGTAVVASAAWLARRPGRSFAKRLFNGGQQVLYGVSGAATYAVAGGPVGAIPDERVTQLALAAVAASLVALAVNGLLVAVVVWLDRGQSPAMTWRVAILPRFATLFGYGLLGVLFAALWLEAPHVAFAILILPPLLLSRWAVAQSEQEADARQAALRVLAQVMETKDLYTRGHGERVGRGAEMVGRRLGFSGRRTQILAHAGMLHDVGKIGLPGSLLGKSGQLTASELSAVRRHPAQGVNVVADIEFLADARLAILHHHERYDGRGYPTGLAGPEIPEFARVIAVVDAFDAMTTARSYRAPMSHGDALRELRLAAGTQFDPVMVAAFAAALAADGWPEHAGTAQVPVATSPRRSLFADSGVVHDAMPDHDDLTHVSVPDQ